MATATALTLYNDDVSLIKEILNTLCVQTKRKEARECSYNTRSCGRGRQDLETKHHGGNST